MIICTPVIGQQYEFYGDWTYDRFEYVGRITTDCAGTAKNFYEGSTIKLGSDRFSQTYFIDSTPPVVDDADTYMQPADYLEYGDDPDTMEIIIKKDGQPIEKFYFIAPDSVYKSQDGCRFHFKRTQYK